MKQRNPATEQTVYTPETPSSVSAPPRYAQDTTTSSITKRVTKLQLDEETRSRRDSWYGRGGSGGPSKESPRHPLSLALINLTISLRSRRFDGGRVSPNGMIIHNTRTQNPDTRHIVEEMMAKGTDDLGERVKGFHDRTKINHHHIQGVSMGGHGVIVSEQRRKEMKERKRRMKDSRSLSPTRSPMLESGTNGANGANKGGVALPPKVVGRQQGGKAKDDDELWGMGLRKKKQAHDMTPIKWFMALDAKSGLNYWYQPWSGETTWHKPPGFDNTRAIYSPPKVYRPPAAEDEGGGEE
jgi:hypothetical protein